MSPTQATQTSTPHLHRAPPQRVYKAFLDPDDLREFPGGTEVRIEQAGIPSAIPLSFATMGWQESLTMLANLVEPDIPSEGAA